MTSKKKSQRRDDLGKETIRGEATNCKHGGAEHEHHEEKRVNEA